MCSFNNVRKKSNAQIIYFRILDGIRTIYKVLHKCNHLLITYKIKINTVKNCYQGKTLIKLLVIEYEINQNIDRDVIFNIIKTKHKCVIISCFPF